MEHICNECGENYEEEECCPRCGSEDRSILIFIEDPEIIMLPEDEENKETES
jgi:hypothetical protein